MNTHFTKQESNLFADLNEQKKFIKFINQINQILTKKYEKPLDTLEIEGLKRDWKIYLNEHPENADELAAQDILMIRDYEEAMFQKFCDNYDEYIDRIEKKSWLNYCIFDHFFVYLCDSFKNTQTTKSNNKPIKIWGL